MPRVLQTAPVLESWDAVGHPHQRRLAAYLDEVNAVVRACVSDDCHHLALELTVGLPEEVALTKGGRDLDNYLSPIAQRIDHRNAEGLTGR